MSLEELERQLIKEHINIKIIRIILGEKLEVPNATGCYKDEQGKWNIYSVSDRGTFVVTDTGDEDTIMDKLYLIAKGLDKVFKEYGDMWS